MYCTCIAAAIHACTEAVVVYTHVHSLLRACTLALVHAYSKRAPVHGQCLLIVLSSPSSRGRGRPRRCRWRPLGPGGGGGWPGCSTRGPLPVSANQRKCAVIRQGLLCDQEIKRVQTRNIWGKTFAMFNWSVSACRQGLNRTWLSGNTQN